MSISNDAIESIARSRKEVEKLIAAIPKGDDYVASIVGPILANLKDAEANLRVLYTDNVRIKPQTLQDLPYELRLCVELLWFASLSCKRTQDKTASEIKSFLGAFFSEETIAKAVDITCGRWENP
jgi:hypothetical protein